MPGLPLKVCVWRDVICNRDRIALQRIIAIHQKASQEIQTIYLAIKTVCSERSWFFCTGANQSIVWSNGSWFLAFAQILRIGWPNKFNKYSQCLQVTLRQMSEYFKLPMLVENKGNACGKEMLPHYCIGQHLLVMKYNVKNKGIASLWYIFFALLSQIFLTKFDV